MIKRPSNKQRHMLRCIVPQVRSAVRHLGVPPLTAAPRQQLMSMAAASKVKTCIISCTSRQLACLQPLPKGCLYSSKVPSTRSRACCSPCIGWMLRRTPPLDTQAEACSCAAGGRGPRSKAVAAGAHAGAGRCNRQEGHFRAVRLLSDNVIIHHGELLRHDKVAELPHTRWPASAMGQMRDGNSAISCACGADGRRCFR